MFPHVGRWPKGSDPALAKFKNRAVRDPRWHLVSITGGTAPAWQLFDLAADPGEQRDVAAAHPSEVRRPPLCLCCPRLVAYVQPGLINETAVGPRLNPFAESYWQQFGGGPTPEQLRRMDPTRELTPLGKKSKQP